MALLDELNWRHAVKGYDSTKKVSEEDLNKILEAARLAPTSSGLQQFRTIVVEKKEVREKLVEGSLNPECLVDCSHIIVFAAWDNYTSERIDTMFDYTAEERGLPQGRFKSYTDKLKEIYGAQNADANFQHAARQAYIGLGFALAQAAELKIDSTPAEGFNNALFDEVLGLKDKGLKSVVIMYVGYNNPETDWLAPMKKVRVPFEEFVERF